MVIGSSSLILIFVNILDCVAWTPHSQHLHNIIRTNTGGDAMMMKSFPKLITHMIPRRMPSHKVRYVDVIKKILIDLVELDNADLAPNVLAPHVEAILNGNVTAAQLELVQELNILDKKSREYECIMAASDYVSFFVSEFNDQKESINSQHSSILISIVDVAKNGTADEINKVISEYAPYYTSTFIAHLNSEIKYLDEQPGGECAAMSSLLRTIDERIRAELETLTTADVQAFREILDTKRKIFSDDKNVFKETVLKALDK
jgi:hypothetical protein